MRSEPTLQSPAVTAHACFKSLSLAWQQWEEIYCVIYNFRPIFQLSQIATVIPSWDTECAVITGKKKLFYTQDSPTPPLSDLHRPQIATRVTFWGTTAEGVMIDSSVSSLADVLSLFPSLKPYHHGVEKPVIPIFPHEKRPQSWLSSALTGEKSCPRQMEQPISCQFVSKWLETQIAVGIVLRINIENAGKF